MLEPKDLPALSREELLALVVELQRQITELRAEIDQHLALAPSATGRPHHARRSLSHPWTSG